MLIEIYTLSYCPYCAAAKRFFDERGMKYTAVPQIIVNGKRIGGYTDMMALLEEGKLKF